MIGCGVHQPHKSTHSPQVMVKKGEEEGARFLSSFAVLLLTTCCDLLLSGVNCSMLDFAEDEIQQEYYHSIKRKQRRKRRLHRQQRIVDEYVYDLGSSNELISEASSHLTSNRMLQAQNLLLRGLKMERLMADCCFDRTRPRP